MIISCNNILIISGSAPTGLKKGLTGLCISYLNGLCIFFPYLWNDVNNQFKDNKKLKTFCLLFF